MKPRTRLGAVLQELFLRAGITSANQLAARSGIGYSTATAFLSGTNVAAEAWADSLRALGAEVTMGCMGRTIIAPQNGNPSAHRQLVMCQNPIQFLHEVYVATGSPASISGSAASRALIAQLHRLEGRRPRGGSRLEPLHRVCTVLNLLISATLPGHIFLLTPFPLVSAPRKKSATATYQKRSKITLPKHHNRTKISAASRMKLLKAYQNGVTFVELARRFKVCPQRVHQIVKAAGLPSRRGHRLLTSYRTATPRPSPLSP